MTKHVLIIGAGVIGAAIAYQSARRGLRTTVVDAAGPAAAASGASFGWINASFHLNAAHFHLRQESIAAHRRLNDSLPALPIDWCGCLYADDDGDALQRTYDDLSGFGYPVERLDQSAVAARVPALVAPPEEALFFPGEAAADAGALATALLEAAIDNGARFIRGVPVDGLVERNGAISGVMTPLGAIAADEVVVASGVGAPALLTPLGLSLSLLERPALLIKSAPLPPLLDCIFASATQELRQLPDGRMLAPGVAAHQTDASSAIAADPMSVAEDAMQRLSALLGLDAPLPFREVALGRRPMPADGLPVVGRWGPPGLTVAVMHSGVTLAAAVGEALAATLDDKQSAAGDRQAALIKPFSPDRLDA